MQPNRAQPLRVFVFNRALYDGLKATIIEGLQLNGVDVFALEFASYARAEKILRPDNWDQLAGFDAVLWGEEELAQVDSLPGSPRAGLVRIFADGSDSLKMRLNKNIRPHLFFKRELLESTYAYGRGLVLPLGFGVEERFWQSFKPHAERLYDYSCMLRLDSNPFRRKLNDRVNSINSQRPGQTRAFIGGTGEIPYGDGITMPQPTPKYFEVLSNSRISINCHGAGQDCLRYWEILSSGAMLFSQRLDIHIEHPFEDGKNAVFFSGLQEFEDKLGYYLAWPDKVEEIARNGYEHAKKFHTSKIRAGVIIEMIAKTQRDLQTAAEIHSVRAGAIMKLRVYNNLFYYFRKYRARFYARQSGSA
jgi:hypothetical protein